MDYKRLRASQVRLDPQNPRLPDGTSSDHEAVNRLLDENYSALLALARDLSEVGESNPAELPIVMKDGAKYLVLEGNRRFAALKLLATPSLADDEKQRAAFARLARKGTPPKTVMCAVDTSRETADHWLVLRHTGESGGVGVRRWNAQQVARHRKRANAAVDSGTARSLVIADELEEAYAQDAALMTTLRRIRASKLTNIGRFFSAEVLSRLHLSVKETGATFARDRTLWAKHSANELHDFFAWALSYIDQNSVDLYKNAPIRSALLDEQRVLLPDTASIDAIRERRLADVPWSLNQTDGDDRDDNGDEAAKTAAGEASSNVDPATGDDDESSVGDVRERNTSSKVGSAGRKNEAKAEKRLYQDLRLVWMSPRTQFLLKEARQIEHELSPGTACVMARVIVELVVSEVKVMAWSGSRESDPFKEKLVACLKILDPKYNRPRPSRPELNPAYLETVNEGFGIRFMHQFVHNPQAQPDPHMSRRFSSRYRPMLEAINTHTGLLTP